MKNLDRKTRSTFGSSRTVSTNQAAGAANVAYLAASTRAEAEAIKAWLRANPKDAKRYPGLG